VPSSLRAEKALFVTVTATTPLERLLEILLKADTVLPHVTTLPSLFIPAKPLIIGTRTTIPLRALVGLLVSPP
jgi:hypothetical protein